MRFATILKTGLLIAALAALVGCQEPPVPSEVQLAIRQEQDLWRAGAAVYAPNDYAAYRSALQGARERLNVERSRLIWLRDYHAVGLAFDAVLQQGETLRKTVAAVVATERETAAERLERLQRLALLLRDLAGDLKDSRLSGRRLARCEVDLDAAAQALRGGRIRAVTPFLDRAEGGIREQVRLIRPLVTRFADPGQLQAWQGMVRDTLQESRQRGSVVLVISKLEGELRVYRQGQEIRRFRVGFGFNMLSDKLYAGDRATPEGRYHIVGKNPHSRYNRALLLDYPNAEDRVRYRVAQRKGQIPRHAGMGSLIEIHGGGHQGLTNGCIALEDSDMDILFEMVPQGSAVTIVGSRLQDNILATALRGLR